MTSLKRPLGIPQPGTREFKVRPGRHAAVPTQCPTVPSPPKKLRRDRWALEPGPCCPGRLDGGWEDALWQCASALAWACCRNANGLPLATPNIEITRALVAARRTPTPYSLQPGLYCTQRTYGREVRLALAPAPPPPPGDLLSSPSLPSIPHAGAPVQGLQLSSGRDGCACQCYACPQQPSPTPSEPITRCSPPISAARVKCRPGRGAGAPSQSRRARRACGRARVRPRRS